MKKWSVLLALCMWQAGFAQDALQSLLDKGLQDKLSEQSTPPALIQAIALEKEIDPAEYYVGPGDLFFIRVGGSSTENLQASVNPEGNLILPAIGVIMVTNMPLSQAKAVIIERMAAKYLSKDVSIHLLKPRVFKVVVSGAVQKPGFIEVYATSRAVQAVDLAGGLVQPVKVQTKMQQVSIQTPTMLETSLQTARMNPTTSLDLVSGSKRNIMIKRRSGELVHVDLQKYALTGDLKANPFLRDGDVVFVPNVETTSGQVYIAGALKNPDIFEYAPGDRILDLLELAHGFTTDADSSEIELVRFRGSGASTSKMLLKLPAEDPKVREETLQFPLQPDDRLFVRYQPKYHAIRNVEITGEVVYPGIYALGDGETRLTGIVQRAGGVTREASLKNAYIQRRAQEDVTDPEFERLKKMAVAEMTENERDYFKIKSRERVGGMGVDFAALFEKGDQSQDVILRDHDLIHIPAQEQTVKVTGQVINPGLYPYKPNMPLKHYLSEAGGYNWNARKSRVRIIRSQTGEWAKPSDDTVVEIGDTIFIPEKPEIDYWRLSREMITVIAQLATIYLVVDRAGN